MHHRPTTAMMPFLRSLLLMAAIVMTGALLPQNASAQIPIFSTNEDTGSAIVLTPGTPVTPADSTLPTACQSATGPYPTYCPQASAGAGTLTPTVAPGALAVGLCTIVEWFTGNLGKGLATLAVTTVGIGALFAKIEWKTAILVTVGVALLFGSTTVINAMNIVITGVSCATTLSQNAAATTFTLR